eukprot:CAMPEP_0170533150 /NCGR_PEP_ID=MMETSP0209-20121228/79418_1 /TAXON_ID=665100 ORGANISM="Litonotus pictus, Strain P1" /NCGR_SAMPLE_ID=MMETSP0209 /ASSEMBLY_ACC=CAM_ASM_000301 /LENGTH=83 /DNA_ID=CAMNT_0010830379 /DNA_START=55 /DNA_END=306 /DNA_ORIENTATION=+
MKSNLKKNSGFDEYIKIEKDLEKGNNKKLFVEELDLEDKFDPNSVKKKPFHDYNHDFEKHSLAEVEEKIYKDLAPEHVSYSFD